MEITTRTGSYYGDTTMNHIFEIHDDQGLAAELYIDTEHHVIMNIDVREDRRGEGLARTLYTHADTTLGGIYHMPAWGCTEEGAGFAQAMGGATLDDETAAALTGFDLDLIS